MAWHFPARKGSRFLAVCLSEVAGTAVAKTHTCMSQQNVTGSQTWGLAVLARGVGRVGSPALAALPSFLVVCG